MSIVYWIADGGGHKVSSALKKMMAWVRRQNDAALIVYGGDVYGSGSSDDFEEFHKQCDHDLARMCAIPGNHDWRTSTTRPGTGTIAVGFEDFWAAAPPSKATVVRTEQSGNARYDHFKDDIPGWRLIFVDTADASEDEGAWPRNDAARTTWLAEALRGTPGRSKILFTHHSRLSCGNHGDQHNLQPLWESLFDGAAAAPLVSFTIAGHDHNISIYEPRLKTLAKAARDEDGIRVLVNGAGGRGRDSPEHGTRPEKNNEHDFCVTRMQFIDANSVDVEFWSFGMGNVADPQRLDNLTVRVRN